MWKFVCLAGLVATALANTEKAIFLGPKTIIIPPTHPNLEDLRLDTLTPANSAIRTQINAKFPSDSAKFGAATWLVLDELVEGQRYELRVCWAATQPTAFRINTFDMETVFATPELIAELSGYSWSRQSTLEDTLGDIEFSKAGSKNEREASLVLLQVLAAADYFTPNKTLMENVPPVLVDIILDPYIFNVLPRSLAPTVGYIIIVAISSWFLARYISRWISRIATTPGQAKKTQ